LKSRIFKPLILALLAFIVITTGESCHYSLTGINTAATNISIDQFFNNSDLAPANLGVTFTNALKDYFQQNSNLKVLNNNGELMIEGVISDYRLNPVAPTGNNNDPNNRLNAAALTRLTISVKVNFTDSKEATNSFKDKSFSFFRDFDSNQNFQSVQEELERKIFDQIMLDIFNATVANW
jgi:hypothetical protein